MQGFGFTKREVAKYFLLKPLLLSGEMQILFKPKKKQNYHYFCTYSQQAGINCTDDQLSKASSLIDIVTVYKISIKLVEYYFYVWLNTVGF